MVARGPSSGWHPLRLVFPSFAGRPTGVRAAVDLRSAIAAATSLYLHQDNGPATITAASAVHTGTPVEQRSALRNAPPLAGVGYGAGHAGRVDEDAA
jgi:hypothetical protein